MTEIRWTVRSLIALMFAICLGGSVRAQQCLPPILPTPPLPAASLTVDQAVAFALQHNPAATIGHENVQIAQTQVTSARATGLPSLTFSDNTISAPTGLTLSGFPGLTLGNLFNSGSVALTQPIWPPNRWIAPVQAAKANVGINEKNLTRTQQQVVFQTRQAFYQLLISQQLLDVARYAVDVGNAQLTLSNATFSAGTAPKLDVYQAEAVVANAQVGLAQAQNNVDVARAALATQLGLPAGTPVAITPPCSIPQAPPTVDPLVAQALVSRPELQQLEYRREQARAAIKQARLQSQVLIDLALAEYQTVIGGSLTPSGLELTGAVSFTPYNGGKTLADIRVAEQQLAQVDTLGQQIGIGVTLDVRSAWLNLQNATQQLTAAETQLTASTEALNIADIRYREGEGILLELEQARLNTIQALTSEVQAESQAHIAAAQLEYAVGSPLTLRTMPVPVPGPLPGLTPPGAPIPAPETPVPPANAVAPVTPTPPANATTPAMPVPLAPTAAPGK